MNRKAKLLLVDDEESFTRIAKLNLEDTGTFEVRVENGGSHVLEASQEFLPDLILLDVIMPDVDGGEVGERISRHPDLKRIPFVYLTAAVSREELGGPSGSIGGRMFIAKPIDKKSLVALIDRVLSDSTDGPASEAGTKVPAVNLCSDAVGCDQEPCRGS